MRITDHGYRADAISTPQLSPASARFHTDLLGHDFINTVADVVRSSHFRRPRQDAA